MSTEVWVALFSFLTAAIGAVRWLLQVYFKQNEKIEDLRSQHERQHIGKIKDTVHALELAIEAHKRQLAKVEDRLVKLQGLAVQTNSVHEKAALDFSRTIDETFKRFQQIETRVLQLSKDIIMIKGKGGT